MDYHQRGSCKLIIGDKKTFALECKVTDKKLGDGFIYIYVNGQQYDSEACCENIVDFFYRVNDFYNGDFYKQFIVDYPELFTLNGNEFYDFFECIRGEQENELVNRKYINKIRKYNCNTFDRGTIFRAEYAFDYCFIALIPNKKEEKLIIANASHEMDNPENFQEIILKRGTFFNAFKQMWLRYQSFPSTVLIE